MKRTLVIGIIVLGLFGRAYADDDGEIGPQGPVGPQGPQGIQGPIGPAGKNGVNGQPGTNGINGIQGPAGVKGSSGANGTNGTNGTNGKDGDSGLDATHENIGVTVRWIDKQRFFLTSGYKFDVNHHEQEIDMMVLNIKIGSSYEEREISHLRKQLGLK